jgi:hypothetical protein
MFLEDNRAVPLSTWFSEEARFNLNGYLNKQNTYVWAIKHAQNIMKTPLHPEKCTMCVACYVNKWYCWAVFSTILWTIIVISASRKRTFSLSPCPPRRIYPVSSRMVSFSMKHFFFFLSAGLVSAMLRKCNVGYAEWAFWRQCCLILFLNCSDMGSHGHHSLQIVTRAIISYGAFWKIQFTKTVCTQLKKWNKFRQHFSASVKKPRMQLRKISDVLCSWPQTPTVYMSKLCVHDYQSPKTTELKFNKYRICLLCR